MKIILIIIITIMLLIKSVALILSGAFKIKKNKKDLDGWSLIFNGLTLINICILLFLI